MDEFELEPGESVTLAVRKHWLVFTVEILPYIVLALVPLVLIAAFDYTLAGQPLYAPYTANLSLSNSWMRFLLGMWWLLMWTGAFNTFTRYFLDIWIITSMRIVDIHQFGFFRRQVTSFLLSRVQDVTTDVEGFLPTLFGFGTLRVETAGDASQHFSMTGIRNPETIRDLILREIDALRQQEAPPREQP